MTPTNTERLIVVNLWESTAPNVATWAFIDVAGSTPIAIAIHEQA
jgi:hypothetical protein